MMTPPTIRASTIEMSGSARHRQILASPARSAAAVADVASVMRSSPIFVGSGASTAGRHQQADLVLLGRARVEHPDDPAAVHHGDPVRQLETSSSSAETSRMAVPASRFAMA